MDRQRQSLSEPEVSSDESPWYVLRDEEKYGPLRFADLVQSAQQRQLLKDDWVWKPGLVSWIAAGDVSGLFSAALRNELAQSDGSASGESGKTASKHNFKERAKHQVSEFALMFFYLWIMFGMLAVHESIVLAQHQIDFQSHGLAFINALVFAKVMLIAEDMHLGRRLEEQPLVYSITFKSILFAIALICFHIAEHVVVGMLHGGTAAESIAEVGANKLKGIVSLGIMGTVTLVPFFILREISRAMGGDKFWSLFFSRRIP